MKVLSQKLHPHTKIYHTEASWSTHLPAPRVLYRKFQQDTREEIPHEVLYCGLLMQYLQQNATQTAAAWSLLNDITPGTELITIVAGPELSSA